jgi:hypothetical protein
MRALRLPAPNTGLLMDSLARPNSASPGSLPCRWRALQGLVPLKPGTAGCLEWSHAESPRFPGNPSHAFAPLYDPGRSGRSRLDDPPSAAPSRTTEKAPAMRISELNHAALASAAYASSSALPHSHARLASGWRLTFAGGESNPLDSQMKGFGLMHLTSSFPRLVLALRPLRPWR